MTNWYRLSKIKHAALLLHKNYNPFAGFAFLGIRKLQKQGRVCSCIARFI